MDIKNIKHVEFELFLREHENSTWTTKNGKEIRIKEMTTDHLKNIMKFFEKRIEEYENYLDGLGGYEGWF